MNRLLVPTRTETYNAFLLYGEMLDAADRDIIELWLGGHHQAEIAAHYGMTESTAVRYIAAVRFMLRGMETIGRIAKMCRVDAK